MRLFADRFIVSASGTTIDLASGECAFVKVSASPGPAEQTRWASRCERFFRLRHRGIAPLVDYGLVGSGLRFEAWQIGNGQRCSGTAPAAAVDRAQRFLRASRLMFRGSGEIFTSDSGSVIVPDDTC